MVFVLKKYTINSQFSSIPKPMIYTVSFYERNQLVDCTIIKSLIKINIMRLMISVLTIFSTLLIVSCGTEVVDQDHQLKVKGVEGSDVTNTLISGEELMHTKCMVCHKLAPTHDELLAPPMRGVQMNYKSAYSTKEEFVIAVVNWASGPDSTKSIMTGAMEQFGLMPYLSYPEEELILIANYIYEADFPKPAWSGKGHGKGKGKGKVVEK